VRLRLGLGLGLLSLALALPLPCLPLPQVYRQAEVQGRAQASRALLRFPEGEHEIRRRQG
jgi:hypothetical protein